MCALLSSNQLWMASSRRAARRTSVPSGPHDDRDSHWSSYVATLMFSTTGSARGRRNRARLESTMKAPYIEYSLSEAVTQQRRCPFGAKPVANKILQLLRSERPSGASSCWQRKACLELGCRPVVAATESALIACRRASQCCPARQSLVVPPSYLQYARRPPISRSAAHNRKS